jgi:SAM-dependent methyltransferase
VDAVGLKWAEKHLPDCRFSRLTPTGPAPFPASSFDVVVAVSVFTHLEEASQTLWLREIQRILRPGGYFLCSTHSAALTYTRPDLTESQLASLSARGFLFAPGGGPFSEDSAFHSRDYLERTWGAMFAIREFAEFGLAGYQDLSVWERRPPLIGAR